MSTAMAAILAACVRARRRLLRRLRRGLRGRLGALDDPLRARQAGERVDHGIVEVDAGIGSESVHRVPRYMADDVVVAGVQQPLMARERTVRMHGPAPQPLEVLP